MAHTMRQVDGLDGVYMYVLVEGRVAMRADDEVVVVVVSYKK